MYQLYLLKSGVWVEDVILKAESNKGRKSAVQSLDKKYKNGTWKVRAVAE